MNPSRAISQKCHGMQAKRLNLYKIGVFPKVLLFSKNHRENQQKHGFPSDLRNFKNLRKKHYAFEFWCLECSSLGPTAKISIHLSNSVWG